MKRTAKVAMWIVVGLLGLVGITAGIGLVLPESHVAGAERVVPGSLEEVWAVMTEVEAMASWRPGLERVERLPDRDGLPVWRESGSTGSMTLQVTAMDRPRRMVTRIADEGLPFGGTWTYELEPADGGTRVRLTENGEIYNPFFRFVSRFIIGHDRTMRAYLDGLEARMGGGDRGA